MAETSTQPFPRVPITYSPSPWNEKRPPPPSCYYLAKCNFLSWPHQCHKPCSHIRSDRAEHGQSSSGVSRLPHIPHTREKHKKFRSFMLICSTHRNAILRGGIRTPTRKSQKKFHKKFLDQALTWLQPTSPLAGREIPRFFFSAKKKTHENALLGCFWKAFSAEGKDGGWDVGLWWEHEEEGAWLFRLQHTRYSNGAQHIFHCWLWHAGHISVAAASDLLFVSDESQLTSPGRFWAKFADLHPPDSVEIMAQWQLSGRAVVWMSDKPEAVWCE